MTVGVVQGDGAGDVVEHANQLVRRALRDRLLAMPADAFERLIGTLLSALGYSDVQVTGRRADGGTDLTGHAHVAVGLVPVRVRVKRWKRNIPVEVVRELRGRRGPGERGLLVTTAAFTSAALATAEERDKVPIWLLSGQQVVDMLVEREIGIRKRRLLLLELEREVTEGVSPVPGRNDAIGAHDPLHHRPKSARTPSGRPITIPVGQHFMGTRASLLPVFSALAGAVLRESADADYFGTKSHIVFTVGDGRQQRVVMLVTMQARRLELRLRLPPSLPYGPRLMPCADKAWRNLRHRSYLTSPGEVDAELQHWLAAARSLDFAA